jgi:hypothetical protein
MIGQRMPQGRRAAVLGTAGAVVMGAAILLGWNAARPPTALSSAVPPDPWALPRDQRSDTAANVAILRARRPWGGTAAFRDIDGAPPVQAALPWRLVGTVVRDNVRFALIEIGPQPRGQLKYFGIGDRLPDSSIVVQIEADSITVQGRAGSPAESTIYRLFHKNS